MRRKKLAFFLVLLLGHLEQPSLTVGLSLGDNFVKWNQNPDKPPPPPSIINNTRVPSGCYNKSFITQPCVDNRECVVPDSFCGFPVHNVPDSPDQDLPDKVCLCKDGHLPSSDGSTCLKITHCHLNHDNPGMESGGCPDIQFCRYSTCLCKPNYGFSPEGVCEPHRVSSDDVPEPSSFFSSTAGLMLIAAALSAMIVAMVVMAIYLTTKVRVERQILHEAEKDLNRKLLLRPQQSQPASEPPEAV